MAAHKNEAFSRVLTDRALTDSGWDLLKGKLGRVLCDLEATKITTQGKPGGLQGIIGNALPAVKTLELPLA